jgi:hypothetical protein
MMEKLERSQLPLENSRGCDDSKITVMLNAVDFRYMPIADELRGLIDYYEIIFKDKELVKKEYEFRNDRLSLLLELINTVAIPEDMLTELRSAIISAWRLKIPGSTREKRSGEISMILHSLERLRTAISSPMVHPGQQSKWQLDVAVLHSISIRRLDLESRGVQQVEDLLDQAIEYLKIRTSCTILGPLGPESAIYFSAMKGDEGFVEHENSLLRN